MSETKHHNDEPYNLDGGPRHLVLKNGTLMAVAPGLRLVKATAEERQPFDEETAAREEPVEYGLPV